MSREEVFPTLDLNSSELVLEAQLADRRRELIALSRRAPRPSRRGPGFSAALAGALAHIAFHLNRQSIGDVVARHPHPAGRS